MTVKELAESYEPYIIEKRRHFHENPELSFQETETTAYLVKELKELGVDEVITFPDYTGCIGILKGGKPGPVLMLRADIDALPVTEATGLPFASKKEGVMHACGHDNHTAMLLGAVRILLQKRDEICGTVRFLFQAAEESCHGAEYYVKNGYLDDVDAVMGMHIWNDLNYPLINFQDGPRMASCDNFKITVHGVSSHGSAPQGGRDALVAAASIIMNLQTFVSRNNSPRNPLVVSVGTIKGGEAFNILANKVEMEGTIRTFDRKLRAHIDDDLKRIICGTAEALGCTAELEYWRYPAPVINEHPDLVRIGQNAVKKLYGEEGLGDMEMLMGSEDFAYLMEKVPGVFGYIGSHSEEKGTIYGNHNNHYDVPEDVLKRGSAVYAQFALDFGQEKTAEA